MIKLFKKIIRLLIINIFAIIFTPVWAADLFFDKTYAQVYFSPNGGCQNAIINSITKAKNNILIQAYSFTSAPIVEALKKSHDLGIKIMVILDRSQKSGRYSGLTYLHNIGIPVWIDNNHAIAHNKIIIIDDEIVITGSFNFTKSAEKSNSENIVIIKNSDMAHLYTIQ